MIGKLFIWHREGSIGPRFIMKHCHICDCSQSERSWRPIFLIMLIQAGTLSIWSQNPRMSVSSWGTKWLKKLPSTALFLWLRFRKCSQRRWEVMVATTVYLFTTLAEGPSAPVAATLDLFEYNLGWEGFYVHLGTYCIVLYHPKDPGSPPVLFFDPTVLHLAEQSLVPLDDGTFASNLVLVFLKSCLQSILKKRNQRLMVCVDRDRSSKPSWGRDASLAVWTYVRLRSVKQDVSRTQFLSFILLL